MSTEQNRAEQFVAVTRTLKLPDSTMAMMLLIKIPDLLREGSTDDKLDIQRPFHGSEVHSNIN